MKHRNSRFYFFYVPVLLIVFFSAKWSEKKFYENSPSRWHYSQFEKILHEKEYELDRLLAETESYFDTLQEGHDLFSFFSPRFYRESQNDGLSVFYFQNGQLEFWTDNLIPMPLSVDLLPEGNVLSLGNSFYYGKRIRFGNNTLVGLILIKTENPYENRFLQNGFQEEFNISEDVKLVLNPEENLPSILNKKGEFLFALDYSLSDNNLPLMRTLSIIGYFLFAVGLLLFIRIWLHKQKGRNKNLYVLLSMVVLIILARLLAELRLPSVIFDLDLFSSVKYRSIFLFSSIGDLFVAILIVFFVMYNFYVDYSFSAERVKSSPTLRVSLLSIFLLLSIVLYSFNVLVFSSLIVDSSISFETFKVLELSIFTFLGFLMFAFLYVSYILLTDKIIMILQMAGQKKYALLFVILQVALIALIGISCIIPHFNSESVVLAAITSGLTYYYRYREKKDYRFSNFIVFVIIFSVFTLVEVSRFVGIKQEMEMKMMAVNLAAEHDPIAEILFVDISDRLENDRELEEILYSNFFEFDYLYKTLDRKYFSGFWDKYDFQVTLCRPDDKVYVVPPEDAWYPCYSFFREDILANGLLVPGSDFYYLDNLNGRISYFYLKTFREGSDEELTLFIELDSRLFAEGLGYPGLLLEDSFTGESEQYSYAKYNEGSLITSKGDFSYSTRSDVYISGKEGFDFFKLDNFDHLTYFLDSKNLIIVSKPSAFWVDMLISFSYIFGFYFITLVLLLSFSRIGPLSFRLRWDFKNKIQFSINSVLLVSFVLFGAGTVYFSIIQYKSRQLEILEEKVQSVYVELIHKLEYETDLSDWRSDSYYNLNELLSKFSNVFYTDINLFREDGNLLATSRTEIYDIGLISRRMNAQAFLEMNSNKRSKYVHNERIGNLRYISVYVPFVNADNDVLAYLNLPYFTRQDELTTEIANLVVAIINVVFLLSLLSFTLALFVSNTITYPLRLIQNSIARLSLNEKNEKINYTSRDEIGGLVREYNNMVDQLQQSAEMLAKSERETAWREMAKQIAHEIKNPLTPMKLMVQHLQRTYSEKGGGIDRQVDKTSRMLIEQIDDLSAIATEFSNFAKMPSAKNEKLDLSKKLRDTIELFTDYERCSISLKIIPKNKLYVYADREQISRVFINLVKNAIQSVPKSETGVIEMILQRKGDMALISIKDNGKGIPEDIRDKLFQPNFTTKSSGMGLGLAIVRNIVFTAGGRIYFDTEPGKGSTFYVELPLMKNVNEG